VGDPGAPPGLLGHGGVDVGIEHRIAGMAQPPLEDRGREPL
jgi:hypothetical protein